jgi:hypothetical protein
MPARTEEEEEAVQTSYRDIGERVGVSCYSGHRHAQRPSSFVHMDRLYQVMEIERSWFEESLERGDRKACFQVRADDGNLYLLSRSEQDDSWTLERVLYLA